MEVKVNALVLRACDYRENDKILTLLTAERGKISAGIRGVKKAGAKLKFAAQPFCFAEYVLSFSNGRYTVINAAESESFYDLRCDVNKFYAACAALEAAGAIAYEGEECASVFYECVKTLSSMCSGDEKTALIKFLLFSLKYAGYGVYAGRCSCGKELSGYPRLRFDMESGAFTCPDCSAGAPVSGVTYAAVRRLSGLADGEDDGDGDKRALRLLYGYFGYKTDCALKSLSEYIKLL